MRTVWSLHSQHALQAWPVCFAQAQKHIMRCLVAESLPAPSSRQGPAPHACVIEELDEEGPTSPPTGASSEGSQGSEVPGAFTPGSCGCI
eukprot:1136940-Pelagomonas_calceolata.AAC.3